MMAAAAAAVAAIHTDSYCLIPVPLRCLRRLRRFLPPLARRAMRMLDC